MRKTNGDDDTYGDSFDNGNVSLCCPFNYVTPETPAIQKKTRVFCSPPLHCETLDDGTAEREREREAQTLKINAKSEQQKATISAIFATLSQRTRQKPRTT